MQRAEGADIALMGPEAPAARYPALETADVRLAALGLSGEGWFDGMGLMQAFRDRSRARGVSYISDRVVGLDMSAGAYGGAARFGGRIACGVFVNASGGAGADVAAMAGIALPVERRKRTVFCYHAGRPAARPAAAGDRSFGRMVSAGGGAVFSSRPADPDPAVDAEDRARPRALGGGGLAGAAARSRHFEALKLAGFWAGHYDMNIVDANVIVGPHPEVENFLCANGFSGHGLQQAAGVGRGLAEWIAHGRWVSLDLGRWASGGWTLRQACVNGWRYLTETSAALDDMAARRGKPLGGGWLIRRGDGGGQRVRPARRVAEGAEIAAAERGDGGAGQAPLFQVPAGQDERPQSAAGVPRARSG